MLQTETPTPALDKPLGESERTTLLVIIAALAKKASMDIETHPTTAAKELAREAQLLGVTRNHQAIEGKLKLVSEAIEKLKISSQFKKKKKKQGIYLPAPRFFVSLAMSFPEVRDAPKESDMANYSTLIRRPWESGFTPFKRATTYARIQDGTFPPAVKVGRLSCWPAREIAAINEFLIASKSDDEIRALVRDLVAQRRG